jgi:hypothetical protein
MAFPFRHTVFIVAIGLLLFCASCEKHPLPEEREAQTEHVSPEKASHQPIDRESEKPLPSPTPAESVPANPHP